MYQPDPVAASDETAPPLRLFVALSVSGEQRRWLEECANQLACHPELKDMRWIAPENMHLTLRFLGETPPQRLTDLRAAISRATRNIPAPELRLGEPIMLPSADRPRVLALVVAPPVPLHGLAEALDVELVRTGWPPRRHPLMPHISLARRGKGRFPVLSALQQRFDEVDIGPPPSAVAGQLRLYSSELKPDGAVYTVI